MKRLILQPEWWDKLFAIATMNPTLNYKHLGIIVGRSRDSVAYAMNAEHKRKQRLEWKARVGYVERGGHRKRADRNTRDKCRAYFKENGGDLRKLYRDAGCL